MSKIPGTYRIPVSRLEELFSLIASVSTLHRLKAMQSPKEFFFPQSENMAAFKTRGKEILIEENRDPNEAFVLFGLRACDVKSLELLDRVFLSDPVDTFYQGRRQNGVIITSACTEPEESCFCGAFKSENFIIDPASPGGDVATWLCGDTLYWKSETKKGLELTEKLKTLLQPADDRDEALVKESQEKIRSILNKLPFKDLNLKGLNGKPLMELFNAPQWADLYTSCLGCGTCTFVCPTCHCYDIQDYDTGRGVKRSRCWDSCMYSDFTLMAHGNPRLSQLERFRQRYMHKLKYFPDNNEGLFACVGCGRCVTKCPVSMNIVKVIKALSSERAALSQERASLGVKQNV